MNTGTVARLADIYARSLLDLAKEARIVEQIAGDLEVVSTLLTQQPELEAFLASPYFAEQTKRDLIRGVLTGKLAPLTVNFLSVMIEHNRGALLPRILERFRQLYRAYQGYEAGLGDRGPESESGPDPPTLTGSGRSDAGQDRSGGARGPVHSGRRHHPSQRQDAGQLRQGQARPHRRSDRQPENRFKR